MAIKKITLTMRQNFGGVWHEPGDYTRTTFLGERYADGDEAMAEKMWGNFAKKALRHPDCLAIKIEMDKPAQPEPKDEDPKDKNPKDKQPEVKP